MPLILSKALFNTFGQDDSFGVVGVSFGFTGATFSTNSTSPFLHFWIAVSGTGSGVVHFEVLDTVDFRMAAFKRARTNH